MQNQLEEALENNKSSPAPSYMVEKREPTADEKSAPVAPLAARARALGMQDGEHITDHDLINLIVQLDEYHTQYAIEFVEYDERIYNFCCNQTEGVYKTTAREWYEFALAQMLL
jgi:hypothetical protein